MKAIPEKYYALIPVSLLCLFCIWKAYGFEIHDFANYYFGGFFLGHGHFTTDIYFPYWFNKQIVALGHAPVFAGFAPNSPFLALLFYPLSVLPVAAAKLVFNCVSAILFVFSLGRLISFYKINAVYVLFVPVLFFVPIKNELFFGQVYFLLFFLLAESWLAYERKKSIAAALFLSLAVLLKVFPVLLVVIFLFRKQYKPLVYTVGFCLVLASLTLVFCRFDVWVFYIKTVLSKASNGEIASAYVDNYQSVFMLLKRIFVSDSVENPAGFFHSPALFSALIFAVKIKILAIGFYITKKAPSELLVFSYWILALILISPYGSTYTFILLLFPFFGLAKSKMSNAKKAAFIALLFLTCNFPLALFLEKPFPLSYLRCFVFVAFFALLLTMVWKSVNWKMVSAATLASLLVVLFLRKPEPDNPAYFLKNSPLLIYDYKVENGRLTYSYWDRKGQNTASFPLAVKTAVPADLTRNEIYFHGKRIASDNGNKRKPLLIDGKTILYLSDSGRGTGFYTLRKAGYHE